MAVQLGTGKAIYLQNATASISVSLEPMVRDPQLKTDNSLTGRVVGIGWVNEILARLTGIQPNSPRITNENSTLDDFSRTSPLKHTLYYDFTQDSGHQNHGNFDWSGVSPNFATTGPPAEPPQHSPFAEWYWRKFCVPPLWPTTAP
jgi:hypothetical protein